VGGKGCKRKKKRWSIFGKTANAPKTRKKTNEKCWGSRFKPGKPKRSGGLGTLTGPPMGGEQKSGLETGKASKKGENVGKKLVFNLERRKVSEREGSRRRD